MVLNQENINNFLNKYIDFVDKISSLYDYDSNIRHLLYLIVPAFVTKYDISYEKAIIKCFEETKIYVSGTEDDTVTATFNRILKKKDSNYYTEKYIILNQYKNASFTNLIDNIVHEFNHAINSINNEITIEEKYIKLRTGLSYLIYDRETMNYICKSDAIFLEEVLNTKQSEEIINIIASFGNYNILNIEFSNLLYTLKNEIGRGGYVSSAYLFQSLICDILIKNKTFYPTISNLRFKGYIEDIPVLFDNVIDKVGSYKYLNSLLKDIYNLQTKYIKTIFFKKRIANKIRNKAKDLYQLIQEYDKKCIYK